MKKLFIKYFPVAILLTIVIAIGILNFVPGTILTGWDNLHPEYNFLVNIKRSLFGVWQEYQGLGLLGGMGHASDLVRQVILASLGSFVPQNILRYIWTVSTLLVGSLGTYLFIRTLLIQYQGKKRELYSLIGSLFYLLNLATVQTFYAPFEAFTSHYAFLPWLLWASLSFIRNDSKKNLLLLLIVALISTPAAYIPTLFVVFLLALSLILTGLLVFSAQRKPIIIKALKAYGMLFIVNAFWLLPFLYFTLTNSQVSLTAKMNQMATPTIFSQNKEFGTLQDVPLLKGFWFNNVDPDLSGNFNFMMGSWRQHLNNPVVYVAGFVLFGIILFGAINVIRNRRPFHLGVLLLFIFSFTMLATDTVPFSWLVTVFRQIPLFGEAFRFPFTKFSILAAFSYSLLFVLGIEYINELKNRFVKRVKLPLIEILAIILIFIITLPIFSGNLFYQKEQLKLPSDYTRTFDFFKKQDQNARIADLPQQSFWGWNFYTWGYGGSGFLWYGIKQPILDRAFDVWSQPLENYYYELSNALYSKDAVKLEKVLNKYQVSFILLDENVYSPSSPASLFYPDTENMLSQVPSVTKAAQFGKIIIYRVGLKTKMNNYLFSTPLLPSSNGYIWGDNDIFYQNIGNYVNDNTPTTYYPFSSVFSNKTYNKDFVITESPSEVTFTKSLPAISHGTINLPTILNEKLLPVEISSQKNQDGTTTLNAQLLLPTVTIDSATLYNPKISIPLFTLENVKSSYTLNVNNIKPVTFNPLSQQKVRTYLQLDRDNYISLIDTTGESVIANLQKNTLTSYTDLMQKEVEVKNIKYGTKLSITLPKVYDSYYSSQYSGTDFKTTRDCNAFRNGLIKTNVKKGVLVIDVLNDSLCTSLNMPQLPHEQGYLVSLKAENITGNPLHFWVLDNNNGHVVIDMDLDNKSHTTQYFVVPPMDKDSNSYSFHVDSDSIGREEAKNNLTGMTVTAIPYQFITHISVNSTFQPKTSTFFFTSSHPNESLYIATPLSLSKDKSTLILSQSYNSGWQAYSASRSKLSLILPFLFGKKLEHVKVNNWENGWIVDSNGIDNNSQIIIIYLPQYIEYFGFLLLILASMIFIANLFLTNLLLPLQRVNAFFDRQARFFKHLIQLRLYGYYTEES